MESTPIAKEAEVTGLSEVREKLEEIAASIDGDKVHATGRLLRIAMLAREARALLESEHGEQMRKDHRAMEVLRGYPWSLWSFKPSSGLLYGASNGIRRFNVIAEADPADAILGTESENRADDE